MDSGNGLAHPVRDRRRVVFPSICPAPASKLVPRMDGSGKNRSHIDGRSPGREPVLRCVGDGRPPLRTVQRALAVRKTICRMQNAVRLHFGRVSGGSGLLRRRIGLLPPARAQDGRERADLALRALGSEIRAGRPESPGRSCRRTGASALRQIAWNLREPIDPVTASAEGRAADRGWRPLHSVSAFRGRRIQGPETRRRRLAAGAQQEVALRAAGLSPRLPAKAPPEEPSTVSPSHLPSEKTGRDPGKDRYATPASGSESARWRKVLAPPPACANGRR